MRTLRARWGAHFLVLELGIGLVASAAVIWYAEAGKHPEQLDKFIGVHRDVVYAVAAPIHAALLGFIIAASAIIVTAAPSDRMDLLRRSDHYDDLWKTFRSAMRYLGAATVACVAGLVFRKAGAESRIVLYASIVLSILAALRVARCVWAVGWVVRIFAGPSPARGAGR